MAHHRAIGQEVGRANDDACRQQQLARFRDEGKDKLDGSFVPAERCECTQDVKMVVLFCHTFLLSDRFPLPRDRSIDTLLSVR